MATNPENLENTQPASCLQTIGFILIVGLIFTGCVALIGGTPTCTTFDVAQGRHTSGDCQLP